MADKLEVQIDTSRAKANLDALGQSVTTLGQSLQNIGGSNANAFSKLVTEISNMRGIDPSVASSFQNVATSISAASSASGNLNTRNIDQWRVSINGIDASKLTGATSAVQGLANASTQFAGAASAAASASSAIGNGVANAAAGAQAGASAFSSFGIAMSGLSGIASGLVSSFGVLGTGINSALTALRGLGGIGFPPGLAAGVAGAIAVVATLTIALPKLASEVVRVNNEFTSFINLMDSVRGQGGGAEAFASISRVAKTTSTDIGQLASNFGKFDVTAKQVGFDMKTTEGIMANMSASMRTLGVDGVKSERVFNALTQMMSKGKVQSEELRQQLGDSLPVALQAMANAVGVSTAQLSYMLEQGQVGIDVLPRFAQEVFKLSGDMDGLKRTMNTVPAAMTALSNTFKLLSKDIGDGAAFGGLMSNLASGLNSLNTALQNPGFSAFAKVLGDITGLLANTFLSALSAVVNMLGGFIGSISLVAGAFMSAVTSVQNFVTYLLKLAGGQAMIDAISKALDILGTSFQTAIGLIGAFLGLLAVQKLASFVGATVAAAGGIAAMGTASAASATGITAASVATRGFAAAIALLTGPIGIAIVAVTALVAAFSLFPGVSDALNQVWGKLKEFSGLTQTAAGQLSQFDSAVKGLGFSMSELNSRFNQTLSTVTSQAEAINAYKNGAMLGKQATAEWANALDELEKRQLANTSSMNAFTETVNRTKEANTSMEHGLQRQIEQLQQMKEKWGDSGGIDMYGDRIKRLQNNLANMRGENQLVMDNMARSKNTYDENARSIAEHSAKIKQQQADFKEWGAVLNETELALAKQGTAMGLTKEKAVTLAQGMTVLKTSSEDFAASARKQAEDARKRNEMLVQETQLAREIVSTLDARKAAGLTLNAVDERRLQTARAVLSTVGETIKQNNLEAASNEAIAVSQEKNISGTEALKQVYDSLTAAQKATIGSFSEMSTAIVEKQAADLKATDATNKSKDAMGQFATSTQTASAKVSDMATKMNQISAGGDAAAQGITKLSTGLTTAAATITTSAAVYASLATTMTSLSTSTDGVATGFETIKGSVPIVVEALKTLLEPLTAVLPGFSALSTALPPIGDGFEKAATNMPIFSETIAGMQDTLPGFVTNMEKFATAMGQLGASAEGVTALSTSLTTLGPALDGINEKIVATTTNVTGLQTGLNGMVNSIVEGAPKATQSVVEMSNGMVSALDKVASKIDDLLAKFAALESAKASAESGGGGGGKSSVDSARYGGFSGSAPESQSVSPSVFANAPHLANGIANTNNLLRKISGGGIPTILHPNEAVVPLPHGRSIPVKFSGGDTGASQLTEALSGMGASIRQTMARFQDSATASSTIAEVRAPAELGQSVEAVTAQQSMTADAIHSLTGTVGDLGNSIVSARTVQSQESPATINDNDPAGRIARTQIPRGDRTSASQTGDVPMQINFNITTPDADSFKRSESQIRADAYRVMREAHNRSR